MMTRLLAAAALLLPSIAVAQATPPTPAPVAPAAGDATAVSPDVALGLSIGVTVAGVGLVALGGAAIDDIDAPSEAAAGLIVAGVAAAAVGPTTGHWYAHDAWTRGLATRLGGAAAIAAGFGMMDTMCDDRDPCGGVDDTVGTALFALGVTAIVVGTIDDIVTAPGAARRHNAAQRRVTVAPMVSPQQAGLAVAGTF